MDILHWLESHTDVHVYMGYSEHGRTFAIIMTDNDDWKMVSKKLSKESLNRAKYTINDILDSMYEELKEYKNNGYLSDNGSAGASDPKSSGRV